MRPKSVLLRSKGKSIGSRRLSVEALEDRRVLATFTVMNTSDAGAGSLRQAIADANGLAGADIVNFAPALAGATINLTSGQLTITDSVTIDGPANPVTIAGPGDVATGFRIFKVDNGAASLISVSMDDLVITGGSAKPEAATDPGNAAFTNIGRGGGIDNRENLTLDRMTLTSNFARRGANLSVTANAGDQVSQHLGTTTIRNSTISNGRSDGLAGLDSTSRAGTLGAHNGGTIVIEDTTMDTAYAYVGGHMDIRGGTFLTIRRSTITNGETNLRSSAIYGQRGNELDVQITLDDVTVSGGNSMYNDGSFGAVHMLTGALTITNSQITNNTGESGVDGFAGHPVFPTLPDPSTRMTIADSIISGNSRGGISSGTIVGFDGSLGQGTNWDVQRVTISNNGVDPYVSTGGLYMVYNETAIVKDCTITGNVGDFGGGVLAYAVAALSIENTTISDNYAYSGGGGMDVNGGNVTVTRSTISGNSGVGFAGGVRALGLYYGATYPGFPSAATLNILQSTISGNSTNGSGGGVLAYSQGAGLATVNLVNSTVTLNVAGLDTTPIPAERGTGGGVYASSYAVAGYYGDTVVTMTNTIVSGNSDNTTNRAPDVFTDNQTRTVFTGSFNFVGNILNGANSPFAEGNPGANGNKVGGSVGGPLNAMLGTLASNGGTTLTHLPMAGSQVIDMGDPATMGGTDQRGLNRVVNGRVDIGSVEVQAASLNLDFNNDTLYNCADMDLLESAIDGGVFNAAFDVNGDNALTSADVAAWLMDAGELRFGAGRFFKPGDANLDGVVDGQDFIIWNGTKFTSANRWCQGDFNQDNVVDGQDFIIWNANKFTSSDAGRPTGPDLAGSSEGHQMLTKRLGSIARKGETNSQIRVSLDAPAALRVAATSVDTRAVAQLPAVEAARQQSVNLLSNNFSVNEQDEACGHRTKQVSTVELAFADLGQGGL